MSDPQPLVLVTGASGFIGTHILDELLASKKYRVRATARGSKVELLKSKYASKWGADGFEAINVDDIASGEFPHIFEGVDAVIHSASSLPTKAADAKQLLRDAEEGTLNVARQAEKAGIKRLVFTSSVVSVAHPFGSYKGVTDQDWNPTPWDDANPNRTIAYAAAKTIAEKKLWEFADAHPHFDVTTLNPPFCYGTFASGFTLPTPDPWALSSNVAIYSLLLEKANWMLYNPLYVDVRDVAKAHVLALTSPLTSSSPSIGRKRLIFAAPYDLSRETVIELIKKGRPEVFEKRFTKASPPDRDCTNVPVDLKRLEDVLGIRKEDFRKPEETLLDSVDAVLEVEKGWVEHAGYVVPKELNL